MIFLVISGYLMKIKLCILKFFIYISDQYYMESKTKPKFFNVPMPTSVKQPEFLQVFNDDEPISVQKYSEEYKIEDTLHMSMKFCFDYVQLSSTQSQEIPACLYLQSGVIGSSSGRPGVDLVFIIDLSGSMMGTKLDLVKKTLEFMVSKLSPSDRLSLITFNNNTNKLSPLISMTDKNKSAIIRIINQMKAYGGTEIVQGLDIGLKTLAGRRITNSVSSIILLSDGKDNNNHSAMARAKEILLRANHEIDSGFSIHTFGYGGDHDATLLNAMAEEKNGGFYFVEHEQSIPLVFSNCLGELISVVADNIQVNLNFVPCEVPCELGKIYSENSISNFRMPPVLSGDTKEAVFMLNFPAFDGKIFESLEIQPVTATVTYKVMKTGRFYTENLYLSITVHPEHFEIEDISLDANVLINFYRVKACDVMKEAAGLADKNNIPSAKELLGICAEELRTSAVNDSEVIQVLIKDLQDAFARLSNQVAFDVGGRADMLSKANNHYAKRAANCVYQNRIQSDLNIESANWFSKRLN